MPTNSTDRLQAAIQKLEAFSRQVEQASFETPLQKTIALVRAKIAEAFVDKTSPLASCLSLSENAEEILQAVEVLTRERLLIEKLKTGTPAERSLAESCTRSIKAYNGMRERYLAQHQHQTHSLPISFFKKRTASLFDRLPEIDQPQSAVATYHFPPASPQADCCSQRAVSIKDRIIAAGTSQTQASQTAESAPVAASLSQQSAELFQMKALALLERYGIASNPEARALVKQAPIFSICAPDSPKCTLSQTLALFPGQTVVVMGNTELDPTTKTICKLFPETFSISLESSQTGFPHASQRAGWSLANELLPNFPQRIDMLPTLGTFYGAKKQAATDLLPQGCRLAVAKQLLKLKRHAFNTHKNQLIALHRQLAHAIVKACYETSNAVAATIDAFFDDLSCQASPYDALAATSHQVQELFISTPCHTLLHAILKEEDYGPTRTSYECAQATLAKALNSALAQMANRQKNAASISERRNWDFITLMGKIFGHSAQAIMLQYLSEDLVFAPPTLTAFEQRVQTAAYRHVEDFLHELYADTASEAKRDTTSIYESMKAQIEWDIALFSQGHDHAAVAELAAYFDRRHHRTP